MYKRIIYISILTILVLALNIQGINAELWSDDFSDGDFTNDPVWTNSSGAWKVVNEQLQLTATHGSINTSSNISNGTWTYSYRFHDFGTAGGGQYGNILVNFMNNMSGGWATGYGYVLAHTIAATNKTILYRLDNGAATELNSKTFTPNKMWQDVLIRRNTTGGFKVFINDTLIFQYTTDGKYNTSNYTTVETASTASWVTKTFSVDNFTAASGAGTFTMNIQQPLNITYNNNSIWFNLTSNETLNYAYVELQGTNHSLTNSSGNWNYHNTSYFTNGTYQATFYGSSNKINTTSVWFSVGIPDSGLELSASPGWSTYEQSINVLCTNDIGLNMTLQRGAVTVNNPYIATLPTGSYDFTCTLNETTTSTPYTTTNTLNILDVNLNCVNETTFAFRHTKAVDGTEHTFNLTTLVNDNIIKPDLTDVWDGRTGTINTTGGYYYTANVSGLSNTYIYFGNYIANHSYSTAPLSENVTSITSYSQENPYYNVFIRDEITNEYDLPPNANLTMTIYCDSGQTTFAFNNTSFYIPTYDSQLDRMMATVDYGSSEYIRQLLCTNPVETKTLYLPDAYSVTVLGIPVYIEDYQYYDAELEVYKVISGQNAIMTEGYFDNEHKVSTYLVKDEQYSMRIKDGAEIRDASFYRPITATDLTLSINTISIDADISLISNNLIMSAENTSLTTLNVRYQDLTNGTTSVTIRVYNGTNNTAFWSNTYNNQNNINITINTLDFQNDMYSVEYEIEHTVYGNSPILYIVSVGAASLFGMGLSTSLAGWLLPTLSLIIMMFTSFMVVPKNRLIGLIIIAGIIGVLAVGLSWLQPTFGFTTGVMALILIFIGVGVVYELKRGGDQ